MIVVVVRMGTKVVIKVCKTTPEGYSDLKQTLWDDNMNLGGVYIRIYFYINGEASWCQGNHKLMHQPTYQ